MDGCRDEGAARVSLPSFSRCTTETKLLHFSMVYIQELLIYICIRVSRDTYNRRGMSNMQLNDGRPGRMARGREVVVPPLVSYRLKLQTVKVELKVESDNNYMAHWCIHPLGPASTSTLNHSIDLHRVDNYAV